MLGIIRGLSSLLLLHVGLAEDRQRRALLRFEQAFHGRERDRLMIARSVLPWLSPVGKSCSSAAIAPTITPTRTKDAAVNFDRASSAADKTRPPPPSRSIRSAPRRSCCARIARAPTGFSSELPEAGRAQSRRSAPSG